MCLKCEKKERVAARLRKRMFLNFVRQPSKTGRSAGQRAKLVKG